MTQPENTEEYIESFLMNEYGDKQPSTVKRYRYDLLQFHHWCQKNQINNKNAYDPEAIRAFYLYLCKEKDYSIHTIRRILSVLKQHYRFNSPLDHRHTPFDNYLKKEVVEHKKKASDFIKTEEIHRLLRSIMSPQGLSDHQLKSRHFYDERNQAIIHLMLFYGLSIQEVTGLTMKNIHFPTGIIHLFSRKRKPRHVTLLKEDRQLLHQYYRTVPKAVRPRWYTDDPFFAAFDFRRGTYRWSYEKEQPKQLTDVALQKMIRQEMQRAGLGRGRSSRELRHTYILHRLLDGVSADSLKVELAFVTTQPFDSYVNFILAHKDVLNKFQPLTIPERQEMLKEVLPEKRLI